MGAKRVMLLAVLLVTIDGQTGNAFADSKADAMAEMQKQLNAQTMSRPFDPGVASEIDAELDQLIQKGQKPKVLQAPPYWRPGYTCRNAWRYSRQAYYNCRHYYRYYGRYW